MPKLFIYFLIVGLICAFFVSADFLLPISGPEKGVLLTAIFFLIVIFFITSYFLQEANSFKKEKSGLAHLLEKNEKKFGVSEMEKNRIYKIFINFDEGILAIDESEKVFMINPMAKKLLGIKSEEIKGMSIRDFCRLSGAEFLAPYFSSLDRVLKEKIIFKDYVVELSAIPLIFEERDMGKLIILRDITQENLLDKMRTDFMLSSVHRLKTSATSTKWSLKMFLTGDFGKMNSEQKEVMEKLYKRNSMLIALADNLLGATKIEDGAFTFQKTFVDVHEIVQSAIIYFQDEIKSKKIKFTFKEPAVKLPEIMADKDKIESVVTNLFDNSLKYTDIGGSIEVFLFAGERDIKFVIKDTGIGIPGDQQSKIFTKFFRASNANKIEANGSGIGLFLAKKIVEGHGGNIWFESEENKGSVFHFTIPVE